MLNFESIPNFYKHAKVHSENFKIREEDKNCKVIKTLNIGVEKDSQVIQFFSRDVFGKLLDDKLQKSCDGEIIFVKGSHLHFSLIELKDSLGKSQIISAILQLLTSAISMRLTLAYWGCKPMLSYTIVSTTPSIRNKVTQQKSSSDGYFRRLQSELISNLKTTIDCTAGAKEEPIMQLATELGINSIELNFIEGNDQTLTL